MTGSLELDDPLGLFQPKQLHDSVIQVQMLIVGVFVGLFLFFWLFF